MTLVVTSVELFKESRETKITQDSISQTIAFVLCGNFFENATAGSGPYFYNDDELVRNYVYDNFPWYREFRIVNGSYVLLFLLEITISQVSDNTWKIILVYDVPDAEDAVGNNDQMNNLIEQYQLGPAGGENNGNGWSDQFTQLSFNTTCDSVHKTTSLMLLEGSKASWVNAAVSLPAGMVIGQPSVVGETEEEITGYDKFERDFKFQITQYFPPQKLKYRYVRSLYRLTATVNNSTFFGFPAGTTLFLGSQASGDLVQNVPVTFEFAVRNNFKFVQGATVLSNPLIDDVNLMFDQLSDPGFPATTSNLGLPGGAGVHSGWSHVDYRYIPVPDASSKSKLMRPAFRYIHKVQEYGDFKALQL